MLDRSKINKILVVSLTNIGDVILTFPVIDILKRDFPSAGLSVVIGPKAESLFCGNPHLDNIYVFDKHQLPLKTLSWVLELRRQYFDLVVDLRNTAIPFIIAPRYRTSCRVDKASNVHMRDKHLSRLSSVYDFEVEAIAARALFIPDPDKNHIKEFINTKIGIGQKYVVIAPGAADSSKQWSEEKFAYVCDRLIADHNVKIVFVGDEKDRNVVRRIDKLMESGSLNLCGRTSLVQLAELFRHCFFTIVNDSAPMHLASYLNVPVLALFGPTEPQKYGPWGTRSHMIKKGFDCPACREPKNAYKHTCMQAISTEDVLGAMDHFIR
ncbi:MAG: glycosyltransferase family 9 protein [Candidatus Omnitrophica bacterium]|nr:glycosyltransferase family 9 protein [Candidatus Omnitrophota bacterium]